MCVLDGVEALKKMFIHLLEVDLLARIFKMYCESDQIYCASRTCSRWRRVIFEKVDISLGVEERRIECLMIWNGSGMDEKSEASQCCSLSMQTCPLVIQKERTNDKEFYNVNKDELSNDEVINLSSAATSSNTLNCTNKNGKMNFKQENYELLIRKLYNSFTYIIDRIISNEVLRNNEFMVNNYDHSEGFISSLEEDDYHFCQCRKLNIEASDVNISQSCNTVACCCFAQNLHDGVHFRNSNSTLNLEYIYPIYECSDECECNPKNCRNRILPFNYNGSVTMDLYLFLKDPKIEFGVKCKRRILKGEFVCEYIGEILSDAESNKLLQSGNEQKDKHNNTKQTDNDNFKSHTYLLIVQEHFYAKNEIAKEQKATNKPTIIKQRVNIDASRKGNISRFLNHSCEPNLTWRTIRTFGGGDLSSRIPRICFFALTDIEANTELTFDYGSHTVDHYWEVDGSSHFADGNDDVTLSTTKCCGSTRCRGFLPFTHVTETD